ncbi:DegQ family serine endoprotease [Sutterella sp.]|uniref:DegQ family serine endoprotease n=1 Tax=Sutterella sp. TaxID=1981025 RepID=UPI0026DF7305|nr:DegQ family serine endoprotease [Sutterella sp.]MDO5530469.1 DegQ family serine endoprotease [Sutterella sp.]
MLSKTSLAAAVAAALLFTGPLTAAPAAAADAPQQAVAQLPDFVKLVEDNGAGVVNIAVTKNARTVANPFGIPGMDERSSELLRRFGFPFPFGGDQEIPEQKGTGSGFIISSDGLIMTNAHVVEGADKIVVRLTDKREFEGKVLGTDKQTDIAVVKIDAKDLHVLRIGDSSKLRVGEWVAAIGSPFGLDNTVTAGIVSALSRNLPSDQYVPFIQTDVAVNPGNSGGPLFNMAGEVVGINSQIFSTSGGFMGLSFAIPIDLAMQIKNQLVEDGHVTRGYVGVYIQQLTQELADSFGLKTPEGALVTKVEKGSPAEKAGLKEGDVITALNGRKVTSSVSLPMLVSSIRPGTKAELTIVRDKKEQKVGITIGTNPNAKTSGSGSAAAAAGHRLGIEARTLTEDESREAETSGLLVTKVGKFASSLGIMQGDILVSANGKLLKSGADLRKACESDSVLLLVQRNGGRIFIPVKFPAEKK